MITNCKAIDEVCLSVLAPILQKYAHFQTHLAHSDARPFQAGYVLAFFLLNLPPDLTLGDKTGTAQFRDLFE